MNRAASETALGEHDEAGSARGTNLRGIESRRRQVRALRNTMIPGAKVRDERTTSMVLEHGRYCFSFGFIIATQDVL